MFPTDEERKISFNQDAFKLADEAFKVFQALYNTNFGSIEIDDNLVEIHSGGWSDNEELIKQFRLTSWWWRWHVITATGGHYYFNTDKGKDKDWVIIKANT